MDIRRFYARDLEGVLELCAEEGWPSFTEDPARALRALTAPGVTTVVAVDGDQLVGFAELMSDGEIQAHLSLIAIARTHRRLGIGRDLLARAFALAGGLRVDLITDGAEGFYGALRHFRMSGFRIYPPIGTP